MTEINRLSAADELSPNDAVPIFSRGSGDARRVTAKKFFDVSTQAAADAVNALTAVDGASRIGTSTPGVTVQDGLDARPTASALAAAGGAAAIGVATVDGDVRTLADNLSDQLNANNFESIQAAIDAAGATGCVLVPANCPHTDATVNPYNIAVTDLRNKQLGVHNVIAPRFPVSLYPFGHDMRVRARASSDMYLEHYNVETSTTQTLSPGWNYNVLIGPVRVGDRAVTEFTGGASLIGPNAQIVLGRETANEEQVNSPNWLYVDETHLDIFCVNSHTGTTDIDQGGSTLLASHDLYILSNQVKPAQNTVYDAPLRVKDLGGRIIAYIPSNINNAMPYGGWQWGAFQMGAFGVNKHLYYQHALTTSKVIWRNNVGTDVASLDNSGHLTVAAGVSSGNVNVPVAGTLGELQVGKVSAAITSTVDAFVAWQDNAAPLNPSGAAGSVLVASRNIANAEVVLATQNAARVRVSSTGARVLGAVSAGVNLVTSTNNGELQLGRSAPSTAITSTTDAFVAWQDGTDPLNPSLTSGALLLASRNIANTAVNIATQNTVRASYSAAGLKVINGFGCNGKTPQTAVTVNAACTDLATAVALVNQLRAALIANGICV